MRTKNTPSPRTKKGTTKAPQLRRLASADLRRLPRPKTGFAEFLEPLIRILETHREELGTCPVDIEGMRATLASVQALAPGRAQAADVLAQFDNTILSGSSSVWSQMLEIYAHAKTAARNSADIRAEVEPFEDFMATGSRAKPTPPATT